MNESMGKKLKKIFSEQYAWEKNGHTLNLSIQEFKDNIKIIKEQFDFIMLLDICGVDNRQRNGKKEFASVYHFLNMENHQRLCLKVFLNENEEIPSIEYLWKNAAWFEREAWDMLGIGFKGQVKKRLLNHRQFQGHPLRKDYSLEGNQPLMENADISFSTSGMSDKELSGRKWVNIGPSHPAVRGTFRVMLDLEDEVVKRSKLEIGYVHRCFEKLCEHRQYNQIIPFTNGLNYCSSPMNNIGWCKAIEELLEVDIPDRAKALRMVIAETARIVDHLLCIGNNAKDVGSLGHIGICLEACEYIYELYEKISGARQTVSFIHIGGLRDDLPLGWISDCNEVMKKIKKNISTLHYTLGQISDMDAKNQSMSNLFSSSD